MRATVRNLDSVRETIKHLETFLKKVPQIQKEELQATATEIIAQMEEEVPEDTGRLLEGLYVHITKRGLTAGANAHDPRSGYNYAVIQHENEEFFHDKGKPFYVSQPFVEGVARLVKNINRRFKQDGGFR